MSVAGLIDELKMEDKKIRMHAAEQLGEFRTKAAFLALLEVAEWDRDKDVRKAAINSLVTIGNPEAIPALERIAQNDRDRGTRREAEKAIAALQSQSTFSAEDQQRAERDARALERHEATQPGLQLMIKENVHYWLNREGELIDEQGTSIPKVASTGAISITNTGNQDRIWAINAHLDNVKQVEFAKKHENVSVKGTTLSLSELEASNTETMEFEFQIDKPQVQVEERFVDLENEEVIPIFSRGMETTMKLKLKVNNTYDFKIFDVSIKKYLKEHESRFEAFETDFGAIRESTDESGRHVLWTIPEVEPNSEAIASCVCRVTLPADTTDPYAVGNTLLSYKIAEHTVSGLDLKTLTGSSSIFQFIRREEEEENPDKFVCQFELENASEFEMDLKLIRIFDGFVEDSKTIVEWSGDQVSEEERSIDPGEVFTLDPWEISVDDGDQVPQFGREVDLSVKYLFDAEVEAHCTIPGYELPFINLQATKAFALESIPSYRRTPVETMTTITSVGTTELQLIELEDFIPKGFEPPEKETIVITKDDLTLSSDEMTVELTSPPDDFDGQVLRITIPHLEETTLGPLRQDEQLSVKYQITAISPKPNEEFTGKLIAYGNIYPEISPVKVIAEPNPITVMHTRRKIKIGKMVRSTKAVGALNEYEVVLRGTNHGTAVLQNIVIDDFIPQGFSLVGDTIETPPVGYEEHRSVEDGRALKWVYETIEPDQTVEIKYKLQAEGVYDPIEVYRMLLG